jgi:hypothetical protein
MRVSTLGAWRLLGVENVPLLSAFKVPRVPRACRFVAAGDAGLKVAAIHGEGFGIASAWGRTLGVPLRERTWKRLPVCH